MYNKLACFVIYLHVFSFILNRRISKMLFSHILLPYVIKIFQARQGHPSGTSFSWDREGPPQSSWMAGPPDKLPVPALSITFYTANSIKPHSIHKRKKQVPRIA